MRKIEDLRRAIDAADDRIIAALKARFVLTREMRELKAAAGVPARDEAREREIFERVMGKCSPDERDTVYGIYEKIFSGSRGQIETIARGVCIVDGKALVCRAKGGKTSYLPGGHIEFGESGREALEREIREELGVSSKAGEFLGVVENAFEQHGNRHAEINLVYRLELLNCEPLSVVAAEPWIEFEWCELNKLENARLLPEAMKPLVIGQA